MSNSKIINETGAEIPEKEILECVDEVIKKHSNKKKAECTVVFVSPEKIRVLNREYYKKDSVTDVLSFEEAEDAYIGEIIICPEYIKDKYTEERFVWELCHAAVHGTFHLIGMHHEDSEEDHKHLHALEEEIINKVLN